MASSDPTASRRENGRSGAASGRDGRDGSHPNEFCCPYGDCDDDECVFDTLEEWAEHLRSRHGVEGPL